MMLLQVTEAVQTGSRYFESIQNPILGLFLLGLVTLVVVLWISRAKKEKEVKELNKSYVEKSATDLQLFYEFENTIEQYVRQNKEREYMAKEQYDLLKEIKIGLDYFLKK